MHVLVRGNKCHVRLHVSDVLGLWASFQGRSCGAQASALIRTPGACAEAPGFGSKKSAGGDSVTLTVLAPWVAIDDDDAFDGEGFLRAATASGGSRMDQDYRSCTRYAIPGPHLDVILARVRSALRAYREVFDRVNHLGFATHVEWPTLLHYEAGSSDHFAPHADHWSYGSSLRQISIVLYCNDVAEGGETRLLAPPLTVAPRAGRVLLFPSFFTHPHEALPPRSGPKYVVVTWITLPPDAGEAWRRRSARSSALPRRQTSSE